MQVVQLRVFLGVALLLCVGLFFWRLDERDLWSSHEGRAAMDASSLLEPDNKGLPRLYDGRAELQKPPLFYWLIAAVAWVRGGEVDGWAVRLPATLSALGIIAVVVSTLALVLKRPNAGLVAGLVLASSVHFPWLARVGRIDMPLTWMVSLSSLAFVLSLRWRRWWLLLLGYLACTVAVLLKGPIGLALPAAIVAAVLLVEGQWPAVWEWRSWGTLLHRLGVWWGLLLVAALVVPVFLWLENASAGEFSREFLWHHNWERGLGGSRLRSHPWYQYMGYLLLYLLPYTPVLLLALFRRHWRDDADARLGLAWLVAVFVLLSASHFKRADYLLAAYPGAAIFLGCVIERWLARSTLVRWSLAGVVSAMVLGWTVWLNWKVPGEESYRDYRAFAAIVRRHAEAPAEVVFFQAETHTLDFRVGRPLRRFVQWQHLQAHLEQTGVHHVIMPLALVQEARKTLAGVHLEELCQNTSLAGGRHERPLTLLRVRQARPR